MSCGREWHVGRRQSAENSIGLRWWTPKPPVGILLGVSCYYFAA